MALDSSLQKKIFRSDSPGIFRLIAFWKFKGYRIVFTNGCFDILHLGHVDYLSRAAALGDMMVIGLNTDDSVRRLKGPARPINDEQARASVLASLRMVDAVVMFQEDTPYSLIRSIEPHVLVKGADYQPQDIVGYDVVTAYGGKVITLPYLEGYSTTALERKIRS